MYTKHIQNNLHSFDVQCVEALPHCPFGSSTFYMCFLSVVKLSLNQRQDKSDGISGIPLYYLYYPIILPLILLGVSTRVLWITLAELVVNPSRWRPPNLEPWGLDLRQDSSERCENGGVLWFRWYPMASRSSHRRGRLFGIQKWKNLGGFHVTLQNDTHCRRFGYALRKITHCNWERLENESFLHVYLANVKVSTGTITGNKIWL